MRNGHTVAAAMTVVLGLASAAAARDRSFDPTTLRGTWSVTDVFCRDCGHRRQAEIGMTIAIGVDAVVNPLGGDCRDRPGFAAFRPSDWRSVAAAAGVPGPRAARIADGPWTVMEGSITCGGVAYFPITAINFDTALYPFDGGLFFLLVRERPSAPR